MALNSYKNITYKPWYDWVTPNLTSLKKYGIIYIDDKIMERFSLLKIKGNWQIVVNWCYPSDN